MNVCVRCRLVPLVNTNDKHIAWLLFGDLLGGPIREVDLLAETYPRQGPQISLGKLVMTQTVKYSQVDF